MVSKAHPGSAEQFDGRLLPELARLSTFVSDNLSVRRLRDVILVDGDTQTLVIACDSNAGMGEKPADSIKAPPQLVGFNAAKVPTMEVLAAGGEPFLVISNLCCDLASTGRFIVDGIAELMAETGIRPLMTGSDETNNPTVQTGVGVTVIGTLKAGALKIGQARAGDEIIAIGMPFFDPRRAPFRERAEDCAMPRHVIAAAALEYVREIVPVGSRGIAHEVDQLAATSSLRYSLLSQDRVDTNVSGGASDCFLVAAQPGNASELSRHLKLPSTVVAILAA